MKINKNKFRYPFLIASFCLMSHTNYGQTNDFTKIASILEKNLVGKSFLGGMYDPPCYYITKVTIAESGEIALSGSDKGCNVTFSIKNAKISNDGRAIKIYQATPKIDIKFYTENLVIVYEAFNELNKILINNLKK